MPKRPATPNAGGRSHGRQWQPRGRRGPKPLDLFDGPKNALEREADRILREADQKKRRRS